MIRTLDENHELIRIQVAERLGWRSIEYGNNGRLVGYPPGRRVFETLPSFIRDVKAAWGVVDYLSEHGIQCKVQSDLTGEVIRSFTAELDYHGSAISKARATIPALAICKAFLQIPGEKLACAFLKKACALFVITWVCLAQTSAAAIPGVITYQGTLKVKGVPGNGSYAMQFRITSQDGTQVYWSSTSQPVKVTNGLFATPLTPSGVNWETVAPYIEVMVEGQLLLPRTPVTATVYAVLSESVVDGAITNAKLAPAVQEYLVPAGAVMMFTGPCPADWTRLTALDNAFPRGGASYGVQGGTATHTHTFGTSTNGAHNHGGFTGQGDAPDVSDAGHNFGAQAGWHRHPIAQDGGHSHSGTTAAVSNLPPYVTMVYCQKI